jgi:hypothetical protein
MNTPTVVAEPSLATRLANEVFWKEVFSPGKEPKREIKLGTRYRTLPGWFPTMKNHKGEVRTREPLVGDLLIHLDTDPDVRAISEFAVKVQYQLLRPDGTITIEEHIPDIAVIDAKGAVFVIDVTPYHVKGTMPWLEMRKPSLERHYAKLGAQYRLVDETTIHLKPLFQNLRLMWKHKKLSHEREGMERLRQLVRDHPLPCTIGALMRSIPQNALVARWSDQPGSSVKHVSQCNPVFTAVMQLAISGEVDVDLDKRFSADTLVTRRKING